MTFISPRFHDKLEEIFGADLRSLAALRVGIGVAVLLDLIARSEDLVAHYTDFGVLPRAAFVETAFSRWLVSLHLMNGTWQVQAALFLIAAFFALALIVGYKTRLVTIVSWVLLISLQTRNPIVFDAGDVLLHMMLFWGIFLPWGAWYSVDRAQHPEWESLPQRCLSWATFAYVAQILMVYWFSAMLKSGSQWRTDGSAIYFALSIDQMATAFGQYWLRFPGLLKVLTYSVLGFEIVGPLMLVSPVFLVPARMLAILGFALMHLGFVLCLDIGLFPLISICSLLGLLPSWFWDRLIARLQTPSRLGASIYYDQDCGFCTKSVRLIKTFFLLSQTRVLPAQGDPSIEAAMRAHNSWVVVEADGTRHFSYKAGLALMRKSPLLWPLGRLLALRWFEPFGERIYRFVANHRRITCEIRPSSLNDNRPVLELGPVAKVLVPFFLLYVFLWNVGTVPGTPFRFSARTQALGFMLRLDQAWNMFAPFPFTDDGWYVILGTLKSGEAVDLFRGGESVRSEKPASVTKTYKNYRWRKYMMNLYYPRHEKQRANYAHYLCRDWNARHKGSEVLEGLALVYFLERTLPGYQPSAPQKLILLRHKCAEG